MGAWSAPGAWPLIAIHAALTTDGKVYTMGTTETGRQTGAFIYDLWNPSGGVTQGHTVLPNTTPTDLFCSVQAIEPMSGDLFNFGGDITVNGQSTNVPTDDVTLLSATTGTMASAGKLNRPRWYASATNLPSGGIWLQGGEGGKDRPEVRMPGGVFNLAAIDTSNTSDYYPRNFVIPDGRIWGYATGNEMYYLSADLATKTPAGIGYIPGTPTYNDAMVMYAPGKVLAVGMYDSVGSLTIDLTGPSPVIAPSGNKSGQRHWSSGTVLPDGKVLVTGGSDIQNELVGVSNSAEIWDPATGQWTVLASAQLARLYHSTALLLPDGRVLVAGGGAYGPIDQLNAEIYSPPYLFNSTGAPASRPVITSGPATTFAGENLVLGLGSSSPISKVTLVKAGSSTHSVNHDQRFIPLSFTQSGASVSAQLPSNTSELTPGTYLAFVFDAAGVPAVARMIRVLPTVTAGPYGAITGGVTGTLFSDSAAATARITGGRVRVGSAGVVSLQLETSAGALPNRGGTSGTESVFTLNAGESIVGLSGTTGTTSASVKSLALRTSAGRTLGPFGTASGTAFDFASPSGFEISGIRGRASTILDGIGVLIRAVGPAAPDTTAPSVVSVSPVSGATDVSTSVVPLVTFSESVVSTAGVVLSVDGGAVVPSTVSVSGAVVSVRPNAVLAASTTYRLTVPTTVTDGAGNRLVAAFSSTFRTAAAVVVPPTTGSPELKVSRSSSRSPSVGLSGNNWAVGESVYVFLDAGPGTSVRFYLDAPVSGTPFRVEGLAPWDFGGGSTTTAAAYVNQLSPGSHTIRAVLTQSTGATVTYTATFNVT